VETKFEQLRDLINRHNRRDRRKAADLHGAQGHPRLPRGQVARPGLSRDADSRRQCRLEKRIAAEREFFESAQIMVATEAAGEGINLQSAP
jgi:hypothetical protein